MRSEGVTGCVCVCLCVCVSLLPLTSHFSNVCLSHKRYDLPNGQWRSEISSGFLWKRSVARLEWFQHCTANAWSAIFIAAEYAHAHYSRSRGGKRPFCFSSGEKTSPGDLVWPPSKVCLTVWNYWLRLKVCQPYRAFAAFVVFHVLSVLRVH